MRLPRFSWALCLAWSPALGAPLAAPITPASQGQLQCYEPDTVRKTCQSLAGYKLGTGGVIENVAIVLVSQNPPISMTTNAPVSIKATQVCGYIRPADIEAAAFAVSGHPATPSQTARLRQHMQLGMKGLFGHEICTAYVPGGDKLVAKETIDGTPQPSMDQKVIWVSPEDGYKVGP